ncbi:DNA gyrase subunit B, partial [Candidatus Bathyarchaeota archaeon]|nr:DNA gyrase subunit B [Candidatus Bathyarchaeota archaeon]
MSEPLRDYSEVAEVAEDTSSASEYTADAIQVLKGLEGVRKRPAMYIGDTGEGGLHEMVKEIVNNSVDEAMADRCSRIDVIVTREGSVRVRDDGHGIPVDFHPGEN